MAAPCWEFPLLYPALCVSHYSPFRQKVICKLQPRWIIRGHLVVWGGEEAQSFTCSPIIGSSTNHPTSGPYMASPSCAWGNPCGCGLPKS